MTDTPEASAPTAAAIARAIAVANGHPNPDSFVARFEAALDDKDLPENEPASSDAPAAPETSAVDAPAAEQPAPQPEA